MLGIGELSDHKVRTFRLLCEYGHQLLSNYHL